MSALKPTLAVPIALDLPDSIRFDGVQPGPGGRHLVQFTLLDPTSKAHGATFYVDPAVVLGHAVCAHADARRIAFGDPTPAHELHPD
jgi:hypothetical protein